MTKCSRIYIYFPIIYLSTSMWSILETCLLVGLRLGGTIDTSTFLLGMLLVVVADSVLVEKENGRVLKEILAETQKQSISMNETARQLQIAHAQKYQEQEQAEQARVEEIRRVARANADD